MKSKQGDFTRRGFITTTIGGIMAAGLLPAVPAGLSGAETAGDGKGVKGEIIRRKLGNTGITLPIVSMGVMNANNPEVVRASYELGVRHFDTAANYQSGNNERMVGQVIKELGVRDEVTIATKIYNPNTREGDGPAETREKLLRQIDESLERLQMDHVDILYVHNVSSADLIMNKAVSDTMKEIRKSGKTRHIGISTHQDMHSVIEAAVAEGSYEVILTVINFTMWDYAELLAAIDKAANKGIGIIAMKTQAGSSRRSRLEFSDEFTATTIATASLKWVLRNPNITTAIPGYTTFEHMREDFSVARGIEYDESEKKLLNGQNVKLGMGFCRQCGICLSSCPNRVDIPTLMRTHMYAARYSNFHHARLTLSEIPAGAGLDGCRACGRCVAACGHEVDIAGGIAELMTIYG